ncbi:hypothetical protein AGDE_02940 [Angomonas deanei]|nr:hypothetical protein AGDE_02940 [Angomonas deanei]|eukprot:EPY40985.1 hypothetical protein AGDE_02940 [Angomonas deanei]
MESESFKSAKQTIIRAFDMDGDGKLTPKDFQIMYDNNLKNAIDENQEVMDKYLPFVGQIGFGLAVGIGCGALCRNFYKGKYWIAGIGFCTYSAIQYAAQMNFVNQSVLETAFRSKIKDLADVNGDGQINREDLNMLVENRMKYIATKLGPGGIAPGAAGYASLFLGFARGVRII